MPAIASRLRSSWPECVWLAFCAANLLFLVTHPGHQTVPFHIVWVSLALIYGFRLWSAPLTAALVGLVVLACGGALIAAEARSGGETIEYSEVPLIAAMFGAMVWHATRRQRALEEVRRIAQKQREFVRNASHQLRTPITVARGYAELISSAHERDQTGEDARVVLDELEQLATISDRLFILAAAQHPEFLMWGSVDLGRLIESAAGRWEHRAPRDWQIDLRGETTFAGDEDHLGTALDALIENAARFTRRGDRIRLEAACERGAVVIRVADDGEGIAADDIDSIFDAFRQAGSRGPLRNGGTGLGLAIVKAIVEGHGGHVHVESTLGEGTTFELRLPPARPPVSDGAPLRRPAVQSQPA
jgi:signal transduction histidine kinase